MGGFSLPLSPSLSLSLRIWCSLGAFPPPGPRETVAQVGVDELPPPAHIGRHRCRRRSGRRSRRRHLAALGAPRRRSGASRSVLVRCDLMCILCMCVFMYGCFVSCFVCLFVCLFVVLFVCCCFVCMFVCSIVWLVCLFNCLFVRLIFCLFV